MITWAALDIMPFLLFVYPMEIPGSQEKKLFLIHNAIAAPVASNRITSNADGCRPETNDW